ncbi:MAG: 30S ribosome-binding factor RbfA [Spirochaetota bacterium]
MDRVVRASQLIAEIISSTIVGGQIKDPRVSSLYSVVGVDVSKDLRHATVRVSGYLDTKDLVNSVKGLNAAHGFIQSRIASKVHWKATPKLRFVVDTTIREADQVINTIEQEQGE